MVPMLEAVKTANDIDCCVAKGQGRFQKVLADNTKAKLLLENLEKRGAALGIAVLDPTTAAEIVHQGDLHTVGFADGAEDGQACAEINEMFAWGEHAVVGKESQVKLVPLIKNDEWFVIAENGLELLGIELAGRDRVERAAYHRRREK